MLEPLDELDHVRGPASGTVILEYGDFECPYSRRAFREIERVQRRMDGAVRFAFRHFPLTQIHPHAMHAALAAEAAALQDRFWPMADTLYHRQLALADEDLRKYAGELELDLARFDVDLVGAAARDRVQRDIDSAVATGEVEGTPTLFIDGVVHRGPNDATSLLEALTR